MAALATTFDYDFSPFGQKIRLLLAAQGTSFQRNDVEVTLPRPTLEKLGITYRRIPAVAIGKDVYLDTSLIIDVLQKTFLKIRSTPFDAALEAWANAAFGEIVGIVPQQALTPEFVNDRKTVFPIFARDDLPTLRPSGLAAWKVILSTVENEFLTAKPGTFIDGDEISLADVHVGFIIRWALQTLGLGQEQGFGKGYWPRIYKWIEAFPEPRITVVTNDLVVEQVLGAGYSAEPIGIDEEDPTGFKAGDEVGVEQLDTEKGAHPQKGKICGLSSSQVVIELQNGIRLHFPRRGTIVRKT